MPKLRPSRPEVPLLSGTFLDVSLEESRLDAAGVALLPVPYDGTASYMSGAREGPAAIVRASRHLEDYDLELARDISQVGIHTSLEVEPQVDNPLKMIERVEQVASSLTAPDRLVGLLGGEHTITIGGVRAVKHLYPDVSVLYLDAHADLRNEYQGTMWSHASVARRLYDLCPLTLVGVRSLSMEEHRFIEDTGLPVIFWGENVSNKRVLPQLLQLLSPRVYVSIDLDVLDPAIMAAVGTPEPGGMTWPCLLGLLRGVAEKKEVVGFDVTELCPAQGPAACTFTAAKLVYKLIGYATSLKGRR